MSTLVLSPPAAGNIGDQALVESVLDNLVGDVRLIVRNEGDVRIDHLPESGRVITETALSNLLYGLGPAKWRDVHEFRELLRDAASFLVIGADIMDGRYCARASIARARMAALAVEDGVPAAVLGFSWSPKPKRRARRALAEASRVGVTLFGRDPASLRRLDRAGIEARAAADVVFTVDRADVSSAKQLLSQMGVSDQDDYVLVNASGLVASAATHTAAYVDVIRTVRAHGLVPILLPHVARGTADDQSALDLLESAVGAPIPRVRELQLPDVVRGLCRRATAVVTGRMHLGVMALRMGTPAVIVSTQGKVEGLLEMFDMPECCVQTGSGMKALPAAANDVIANRDLYVSKIGERLPKVVDLARQNFEAVHR